MTSLFGVLPEAGDIDARITDGVVLGRAGVDVGDVDVNTVGFGEPYAALI